MLRWLFSALLLLAASPAFAQGTALSNLTPGTGVAASDLFYDVQTPGTGGVKVTAQQIATFTWASPLFTGTITTPDNATWKSSGITNTTINNSSIGQTTAGLGTFTTLTAKRVIGSTTSVPTNNACTGFALATGSTDFAGKVSFTSATSCAINFGTAFANAPFCTVSPGSAPSTVQVGTTTGVLTVTLGTANTSIFYICAGS